MNKRQKKKKNTKYVYTFGVSYRDIRLFDRRQHELHIKYIHQYHKYLERRCINE